MEEVALAAFADGPGTGNPAVVVLARDELLAAAMQRMAAGFGVPATAFVAMGDHGVPSLRWFSPTTELSLCGHGTLAAAYVVMHDRDLATVTFSSPAGELRVERAGDWFVLQLPAAPALPRDVEPALRAALGVVPVAAGVTDRGDVVIEVTDPDVVAATRPDFSRVGELARHAVIVTATGGADADVTSRVFAPAIGIDEDHATGSAHAAIGPWWFARLGPRITARQASPRGGLLRVEDRGDRVAVAGMVRPI